MSLLRGDATVSKGMVNLVPRDADYPIPTIVDRVRYRGVQVPQGGVIGCGPAKHGRKSYCSSSVSCWDCWFSYGQCRHCGVPHFVTGKNLGHSGSIGWESPREEPTGIDGLGLDL